MFSGRFAVILAPCALRRNLINLTYKVINSPVRLTPVVGVTPGAHYRTSIQELLHLRNKLPPRRKWLATKNSLRRVRVTALPPLPKNRQIFGDPDKMFWEHPKRDR